jgi:hypothetical protein
MNDRLQDNLARARAELLRAQFDLSCARRLGVLERVSEQAFCLALDRAWDAQCMANPGLQ